MIKVIKAEYKDHFKLLVHFSDNSKSVIDFEGYVLSNNNPYTKYQEPKNFKKFKIENDTIVWGKNWDIIFPAYDLYNHTIDDLKFIDV